MPWVRGKKYSFWEAFFGVSGIRLPPKLPRKSDIASDPGPKEVEPDAAPVAAAAVSYEEIVAAVIAALAAKGITSAAEPASAAPAPVTDATTDATDAIDATPVAVAPASTPATNYPPRPWSSADDKQLIRLKEEEGKPWKYIVQKLKRNKRDIRRHYLELIEARDTQLEERAKRRAKRKEEKEKEKGKEKEVEPKSGEDSETSTKDRRKSAAASWAKDVDWSASTGHTYVPPNPWSLQDNYVGGGTYIPPHLPKTQATGSAAAAPVSPVAPVTSMAPHPFYWQVPQYQYYHPGFTYAYASPDQGSHNTNDSSPTLSADQINALKAAGEEHEEGKWDYLGSRLYDGTGVRVEGDNLKKKLSTKAPSTTGGRSRKGTKASKTGGDNGGQASNSGGQNIKVNEDPWAQYTGSGENNASNDTGNQARGAAGGGSWDQPNKPSDDVVEATDAW